MASWFVRTYHTGRPRARDETDVGRARALKVLRFYMCAKNMADAGGAVCACYAESYLSCHGMALRSGVRKEVG